MTQPKSGPREPVYVDEYVLIPVALLRAKKVSPNDLLIYATIRDLSGDDHSLTIPQRDIAARCDCCVTTVRSSINKLEKLGFIARKKKYPGDCNQTTLYVYDLKDVTLE